MTCVAGIVRGRQVWIGGDSAGVSGFSLTLRADEKVFRNGPAIFGFTTSFRMGDILRYHLAVPPIDGFENDLRAYMVKKFIPAVRDALAAHGYLQKKDERVEGGTFLVGIAGCLFQVCNDLQVAESQDGYDAIGCGHEIAKGVLFANAHSGEGSPNMILHLALEAAEHHSSGVRGPFTILELDEKWAGYLTGKEEKDG